MSLSFKKNPVVKDWNQGMKQVANRNLRAKMKRGELDDLLSGKSNRYRRVYESWDISDYAFRSDLQDAAQPWTLVWVYERIHLLDDLLLWPKKPVNAKPVYEWVQREVPVRKTFYDVPPHSPLRHTDGRAPFAADLYDWRKIFFQK
ncbi:hypothetical protein EFP50_03280 [Lacticaseibacillus paracasei]|uniref:hypothetical protein n=1 Tax=Lacticaseibacillus paracasei TaxID=1597 RepID=UPI0021A88166|nr:hypothetical protein [Lacticaseibacillus paracasei]MCT3324837.1 hypothetical protein [Lacticaseibacillus paracasei]